MLHCSAFCAILPAHVRTVFFASSVFFCFRFFAFFGFVIRSVRVDFVAPPDTSSVHLLGSRRVGVGLNVCGVVLGLSSQFYFYNLFIHVFIILL